MFETDSGREKVNGALLTVAQIGDGCTVLSDLDAHARVSQKNNEVFRPLNETEMTSQKS